MLRGWSERASDGQASCCRRCNGLTAEVSLTACSREKREAASVCPTAISSNSRELIAVFTTERLLNARVPHCSVESLGLIRLVMIVTMTDVTHILNLIEDGDPSAAVHHCS